MGTVLLGMNDCVGARSAWPPSQAYVGWPVLIQLYTTVPHASSVPESMSKARLP
jgi:hypothetical protein